MHDSISKLRSSPISTSWEQGHDSNLIASQLNRISDCSSHVDEVMAHSCTLNVVEAHVATFRIQLVESKSKEYEAKSTKNSRAGGGEQASDDQRARCDAWPEVHHLQIPLVMCRMRIKLSRCENR